MILMNGPWTGSYRAGIGLKPGLRPWVSRAAAEFLLRQLHDDAYLRREATIGR